jgi:uncharacterized protein YeaO (DUF488 family)
MSKRIAAANVKLKRACDPPAASDGTRILIDRVWPRGVNAAIDQWDKRIAPKGWRSYLGAKLFATANALRSSVSKAIFWASMTSPATR